MTDGQPSADSPLREATPDSVDHLLDEMNQAIPYNSLMWLAGLLEGEGYFGCRDTPRGLRLAIKLSMTDEDVVRKAARLMGAKSVRLYHKNEPKWKDAYIAAIVGYKAERLMEALLPYMGVRRSAAISSSILRWRSRPHNREHRLPPTCHPERKHWSKGLCKSCYSRMLYRDGRLSSRPFAGDVKPQKSPKKREAIDLTLL